MKRENNELIDSFMNTDTSAVEYGSKYHSSYDWLMPVVEKIQSLGFNVIISNHVSKHGVENYVQIWRQGKSRKESDATDLIIDDDFGNRSKITGLYESVVEFIQWYNKQV